MTDQVNIKGASGVVAQWLAPCTPMCLTGVQTSLFTTNITDLHRGGKKKVNMYLSPSRGMNSIRSRAGNIDGSHMNVSCFRT